MNYDIANPDLAEGGARRVAWAGRRMQVLETVRERFRDEKPLDGHVVAACLHVTASHFRWHGDAFTDGQIIDTITPRTGHKAENNPMVRAEPSARRLPQTWILPFPE